MQKFIFQRISPSLLGFEFDENEIHSGTLSYFWQFLCKSSLWHTASGFISGERETMKLYEWSKCYANIFQFYDLFCCCCLQGTLSFKIEKVQFIVLIIHLTEKNIKQIRKTNLKYNKREARNSSNVWYKIFNSDSSQLHFFPLF